MRGDCQIGIYTVINVATRMIGTLFLRLRIFADCVTNVRHVFASKYPIIEKKCAIVCASPRRIFTFGALLWPSERRLDRF